MLTRWFVYKWRKPQRKKTLLGDFKVTTPENPLLSKQAATNKGISVPYTNLQLNSYPNTELDLFYNDNISFQYSTPSMWLTNRCTNLSMWLTTNLRRMLAGKFFNSSTRWRSRNFLVTKPYSIQMQQLLEEKDELSHISPVIIYLWKNFCIKLHQLCWPLK